LISIKIATLMAVWTPNCCFAEVLDLLVVSRRSLHNGLITTVVISQSPIVLFNDLLLIKSSQRK